jgi:putative transposase
MSGLPPRRRARRPFPPGAQPSRLTDTGKRLQIGAVFPVAKAPNMREERLAGGSPAATEIVWLGRSLPPAPGNRSPSMRHRRLPRFDLPGRTYFVTCCLEGRRPLFRHHELAELILALYSARRDRGEMALHAYCIMPDHYHMLVTLHGDASISSVVRATHSLFAPTCRRVAKVRGRLWQRRFYDHVIRDAADFQTRLSYVHGNPVRAGLVEEPVAYPWSSLRFWEEGIGPVRCDCWG